MSLQEAWTEANSLSTHYEGEQNDFDDEQLHAQQHNGMHPDQGEHDEEGEEDEDADQNSDDDMMDRMSSSPSIEDGAYHKSTLQRNSTRWPTRSSSLTPSCGTLNRSASSTPDSSLLLETPAHPPLPMSMSMHGIGQVGDDNGYERDDEDEQNAPNTASSLSTTRSQDSSPSTIVPQHPPLFCRKSSSCARSSTDNHHHHHHHHHLPGEYHGQYASRDFQDDDEYDDDSGNGESHRSADDNDSHDADSFQDASEYDDFDQKQPTTVLPRSAEQRFARSMLNLSILDQDASDEADLNNLLLPDDDSLLGSTGSDTASLNSTASSSSWATVSDASNPDIPDRLRDDDSDDFSLYQDERFVDSGWGGECLRETEDIDFDFVYALHTFVATVEGQANATKGDTMVLLDDSNSYWWLVRIVKDSSIGKSSKHITSLVASRRLTTFQAIFQQNTLRRLPND